jgi:Secretion system C-terminal sorting domain
MKISQTNRPVIICRSVILLLVFFTQTAYSQSITLPFFDDFSQTKGTNPDPKLWVNGGVSINNTFSLNPPSANIATFDGRNTAGLPYDFTNKLAYGQTDTLTSRPIDLSTSLPADSVYLSFFWEARGLGELPDNDDTLMVSFLDNSNKWIIVWKQQGVIDNNFRQKLIAIKSSTFFHKNFQFRFEAKGRQSGPFDTWHVDFVYLNKKRRLKDIYTQDVACRAITNTYLKRYSAMPMRQYLVNPAAEVNSTMEVEISNLQKTARIVNFSWQVSDTVSKTTYANTIGGNETITAPTTKAKSNKVDVITTFKQKNAVLKFKQFITYEKSDIINLPDSTNNVPENNLTANDSISTYTILDDFYAYDDGTAEVGADYDQSLGKAAVQFVLSKADTVGAVRFNFSPYFKDISGQFFLFQILESAGGKPGKILHQQSAKVQYSPKINGFTEYQLDLNVAVKDTFYVAWTKVNEDVVAVGIDKNTPQFANKIFYNNGSVWTQNTSLKGSLMVRPVIGSRKSSTGQPNVLTANEVPIENKFIVSPNPTSGMIKWNLASIKSVNIFDISGREVFSKTVDSQELSLENLPENTYFINFSDGKKNFIRKIVVLH